MIEFLSLKVRLATADKVIPAAEADLIILKILYRLLARI